MDCPLLHFYLLCNFGGDVLLDGIIEDGFDSKSVHPVNSWFDGLSVFASHKLPVKGFLHDLPEEPFAKDGFSQLHELKLTNEFLQSKKIELKVKKFICDYIILL